MKFKKAISLLLCLILTVALTVPAMAADFSDTKGHWAEHQISVVSDAGIVSGYPDGSFRPENYITREQFAKVVANFMGYTEKGDVSMFPDVNPKGNLTPYVAMCVKAGVLGGFPDGTMRPGAYITREQAAAMLCRAFKLQSEGLSTTFKDRASITAKLDPEVAALERTGLIMGFNDGTFKPRTNLTRAQMMVIISRLLVDANGNFASLELINNNGTETVNVLATAYNDYSLNINVPDKSVSVDKFTLKAKIDEIPGNFGAFGSVIAGMIGEIEEEILTGESGIYKIRDYAYNAFRFNFGTVHMDVNGNKCVYNVYSKILTDGSVNVLSTPTDKAKAAAAFAPILDINNLSINLVSKGNSVTLANGSYLQIGTERLCFTADHKGDLVLNLAASSEELEAASRAALSVSKGYPEVNQATLFIKAGTAVATDKGTFTLKKDITVTLDGIIGEYDGTLSKLRDGDIPTLYGAVVLFNDLLNAYSGSVLYLNVKLV